MSGSAGGVLWEAGTMFPVSLFRPENAKCG